MDGMHAGRMPATGRGALESLRAALTGSTAPPARWACALLRSCRHSLRARRLVRIWQDRDGLFHYRRGDAAFVSPQLHELDYPGVAAAVDDHWLHGLELRPGDSVVDAGAGIGDEALVFSRRVGPSGRVLAVEAHPRTFACLARAVGLNRLDNVAPVHAALGRHVGTVSIDFGDSYLTSRVGAAGTPVPATTLDALLDAHGIAVLDLLKINIEGAEADLLRGATLSRVRRVVVSCHDFLADADPAMDSMRTYEDVGAQLAQAGFRVRTRDDDPRPWIRYYLYAERA